MVSPPDARRREMARRTAQVVVTDSPQARRESTRQMTKRDRIPRDIERTRLPGTPIAEGGRYVTLNPNSNEPAGDTHACKSIVFVDGYWQPAS